MNIPLGDTNSVKWVDGGVTYDLDYLVLDGVTIWEKVIEFTATATYDPITKVVQYAISGDRVDEFTKWSYQAVRQSDGLDTGQVFVLDGLTKNSGTLGVAEDGTWDVTFNGYIGDDVRGTQTATVTVATPFIEITSIEYIPPPEPVISQAQISIQNGSQEYFVPYEYHTGVGHMHLPVLVKATCSTLGLDNDYLGMMFIFQSQTFGHHWFTLGLDGMEYHPSSQSWSAYGDAYPPGNSSRREYTCTYIRLVEYTGEGWYNIGVNNTTDHDTSVLKHPHSGVSTYTNACTTAWSPPGQSVPNGHFTIQTLGSIPGGWANGICVARNLGFGALYGPATDNYGRGGGYPRIGASYTASANSISWSELFEGDFQINNFMEYGSDPSHRAAASFSDAQNINTGWLDGCAGPKGTGWSYYTTAGMTVNGQAWSSYGGNKGWSQVHQFIDNPPQ